MNNSLSGALSPAAIGQRNTAAVVWSVWALMLAAGLGLVQRYGFRMPFADEWHTFDVLMGRQPLTLAWLWSPLNEHRMLLPRVVYLGLTWLSDYRFHAAAYGSFLLQSAAAAALILAARRLRGHTSLADAFFPLLLLNWGAVTNLPWGFEICFAIPSVLVALALIPIACCTAELTLAAALWIGVCLLAAGLCGAFSLPFLPPLGCWLLYAALRRWRSRTPSSHGLRDAVVMVVLAGALFGFTAFYFVGLVRPAHHAAPPGWWAAFCTALEFMTNSLGKFGKETWPVSGALFFLLCVLSLWQLLRAFWQRPDQRVRASGLLGWYAGIAVLAAGLGYGRAFMGSKIGFTDRYMTLVAPYLALCFLQTILYSSPVVQRRVQGLFCLLLAALALRGFYKAPVALADYEGLPTLQADMRLGFPPQALARRYAQHLAFAPEEMFVRRLEILRDARIGPYRNWNAADRAGALSIEPLRPLEKTAPEPVDTVLLGPGKNIVQRFSTGTAAGLYRLDLQLLPKHSKRFAGAATWCLEGIAADGVRTRVMGRLSGSEDSLSVDYLPLRFAPIALRGPTEFTLTLSISAEASPKAGLGFALYAVADKPGEKALRGFLFFDTAAIDNHQ